MKKQIYIFLITLLSLNGPIFAANFTACKGKFALCTTAKCTPIAGKSDMVACNCTVKTGYSAASKACQPVKKTAKGDIIYSRYYPIKNYVSCTNNRSWAWCLDSPCVIDMHHPSKASCACSLVSNQGDYVIVTNKLTKSTCTTNVYSSATVLQVNQISDFLKTQKHLKPLPIKVIESR